MGIMLYIFLIVHLILLNGEYMEDKGRSRKKNLLFIMADDLRPDLPSYGRNHVIAPNFDRLSKRSMTFDRAYNQLPVCFPSRHSILTGLRPDTTGILTWTDAQMPYLDSLMSILVRNQYYSAGYGKLFHHPHNKSAEYPDGRWDGSWYRYQNEETKFLNSSTMPDHVRSEEEFRDYEIATYAIDKMKMLSRSSKKTGRPFLLTVGFKLPHTQYHIPSSYVDLYRNSPFIRALAVSNDSDYAFPRGTPRMNYRCCASNYVRYMQADGREASQSFSQRLYGLMEFPARARVELALGYLAGITFLDKQLGRVLDALEALGEADDTVIVFTSDHGMHVGEKGMWEKYTLFEETSRVPLIISDPDAKELWGGHYSAPVESVDILPTILSLLGLRRVPVLCPRGRLCVDMEGRSLAQYVTGFVPQWEQKLRSQASAAPVPYALSQMRRCQYGVRESHSSKDPADRWSAICAAKNKGSGSVMGYSLRSLDWRYTAWFPFSSKHGRVILHDGVTPMSEELYVASLQTQPQPQP